MGTCYYINLTSFIGTDESIRKIGITNWLSPKNASSEKIDWNNSTVLAE